MAKVHKVWEMDIVEDHHIIVTMEIIILDKEILMDQEMEEVEAFNRGDITEGTKMIILATAMVIMDMEVVIMENTKEFFA